MRTSRSLRHRALANRTRYAVRLLTSEVLPSLVESMQTMSSTVRIQNGILERHLAEHKLKLQPETSSPNLPWAPTRSNGGRRE